MLSRKKYIVAPVLLVSLLLFTACIRTIESEPGSSKETAEEFTLVAEFSGEDGAMLDGGTVRLSLGESGMDYAIDASGQSEITGLPRSGGLLLTVLDAQGQAAGTMPLSISEGAVTDASTGGDGTGYITLQKGTGTVAVSFLVSEGGSLTCRLLLA